MIQMTERYDPAKTVFVDMDGVIADFDGEAARRMEQRYTDFQKLPEHYKFYFADNYPEWKNQIREVISEEGFFGSLPVMNGAIEGWGRIVNAGFEPRILSSPLSSNPTCEADKRRWLQKVLVPQFGTHIVDDAVVTKDKHLYDGIALIDDRPEVRGTDTATWSHVVFDQPYNRISKTDLGIFGWSDEGIEAILEVAHSRYLRRMGKNALFL